jgi:hypothetical protein
MATHSKDRAETEMNMTTNLKVLMSAVAGSVLAVALFVSVPAHTDMREPADARLVQDDLRDPHTTRFAHAKVDARDLIKRFAEDDPRDPHNTRFTIAGPDARDPADIRFAQDDNRDLHNSRFVIGIVIGRTSG